MAAPYYSTPYSTGRSHVADIKALITGFGQLQMAIASLEEPPFAQRINHYGGNVFLMAAQAKHCVSLLHFRHTIPTTSSLTSMAYK